jgi:hypothetical protein
LAGSELIRCRGARSSLRASASVTVPPTLCSTDINELTDETKVRSEMTTMSTSAME